MSLRMGETQSCRVHRGKEKRSRPLDTWRIIPSSGRTRMLKRSIAVIRSGQERDLDHWIFMSRSSVGGMHK
jgi:hypothetical protein